MSALPARAGSSVDAPDSHLSAIDGLRGLAVLSVVAFHAASAKWGPAINTLEIAGARGVDLFFVLSGFCLALPTLAAARRGGSARLDAMKFWKRRLWRIVPPYYGTLLLFVLLGFTPFNVPSTNGVPLTFSAAATDLVRDAAFLPGLQAIYDPVLWSLGVEMRWYVLFPIALGLFVRSRAAFAVAVAALWVWYATPYSIAEFGMLPAFLLGIVAAAVYVKSPRVARFAAPLCVPALAIAFWQQSREPYLDHGEISWQIACFLIVVAASLDVRVRSLFSWRPLVWTGIASYSIYLIHAPVVYRLAQLGVNPIAGAICGVAAGAAFWYVWERPWMQFRKRRPQAADAGTASVRSSAVSSANAAS